MLSITAFTILKGVSFSLENEMKIMELPNNYDVIIAGTGVGGLYTALACPKASGCLL